MAEPQRALFLHTQPETLPPAVSRIYAGAEFCPWRLPATCDLQGGNTQFLRVERLPDDLPALGIDRVVEHLELPR